MKKLQFLNYEKFSPRLYQELIAATAVKKNTLCILPTGLGKTYIALLVSAYKLEESTNGKILMVAPTRPLVNQHLETFKKNMILDQEKIIALTGKIHANDRRILYERGLIFFATPQIIRNDVDNKILDLGKFSLLIIDECHRSVKQYAYTEVVERYLKSASHPLILGLTASPGGMKDKIDEVKKNLKIEAVEIRTEKDEDVKPYVKETKVERVYVEFPEEFQNISKLLKEEYEENISALIRAKLLQYTRVPKRELLDLQMQLGKMYNDTKDFAVARMLVVCAKAIKIEHAIGLLETQGIVQLNKYFSEMEKNKSSANRQLLSNPRILEAIRLTKELYARGVEHPKMGKLMEMVKNEISEKKNTKIIIFANYRDTVERIVKLLKARGIEAREFIGQAKKSGKGLSQKEQIQLLNEFGYEIFNVLVCTSIGEEGLSVPAVDIVIFYEPVPSEIRTIQRRGRTGRTESGRVIFLITKGTRDESYYWTAYHKEKRMKSIIDTMKETNTEKKTISDWFK